MTAIQFDEMIAHTWSLPLHAEIRCSAEPFTHLNQEVVPSKNKMHQMELFLWLKRKEKNKNGLKSVRLNLWGFVGLRVNSWSTLLSADIGREISTSAWTQMSLFNSLQNVIIFIHFLIIYLQPTFIALVNHAKYKC